MQLDSLRPGTKLRLRTASTKEVEPQHHDKITQIKVPWQPPNHITMTQDTSQHHHRITAPSHRQCVPSFPPIELLAWLCNRPYSVLIYAIPQSKPKMSDEEFAVLKEELIWGGSKVGFESMKANA